MTIATTDNRRAYAGDGLSTAFAFSFPIVSASDLKVMTRSTAGTESTLALNTDYTVAGAPFSAGGTVTTTAAPPVGVTLVIIAAVPCTQPVAVQDGGPLPAATLNGAFDRLTMIARRAYDLLGRVPLLRDTDTWGAGQIDAGSNEIVNLDDGTAPTSAATVGQVQAMAVASSTVPAPVASDVGKPLVATAAGAFGWTGTLAADLTINKTLPSLILNKSSASTNINIIGRNNGVTRWNIVLGDGASETGGNTGSDFDMNRYSDAGSFIDTPIYIKRSDGVVRTASRPIFNSNLAYDSGNLLPIGRNVIINGDFSVWQRGVAFSPVGSGIFTADRWITSFDGSGNQIVQLGLHALGTPTGRERRSFLNWNQSTAGSGSTFRLLLHRIKDVRTLAGQAVTFSFYAYADAARALSASLTQYFGSGGSPSSPAGTSLGGFSVTTTPQRFVSTVTLPGLAGKTLGSNGDDYLQLSFGFPLNAANSFNIWDVQIEPGPVATEFERKSFERELLDCLPYYEKSFPYAQAPQQNPAVGATGAHGFGQVVAASTAMTAPAVRFRSQKRATPTVTLYNPQAANAQIRNTSTNTDFTSTTASLASDTGFSLAGVSPAASVAGHPCYIHWTAEAEL